MALYNHQRCICTYVYVVYLRISGSVLLILPGRKNSANPHRRAQTSPYTPCVKVAFYTVVTQKGKNVLLSSGDYSKDFKHNGNFCIFYNIPVNVQLRRLKAPYNRNKTPRCEKLQAEELVWKSEPPPPGIATHSLSSHEHGHTWRPNHWVVFIFPYSRISFARSWVVHAGNT